MTSMSGGAGGAFPPGDVPWERRRLVTVERRDPDVYELTVWPGADVLDLVGATAALPRVVFVDHRRAAPGDAAAVLVFRALPAGVAVGHAAAGGGPAPGWVPDVGAVAGGAPSVLEEALSAVITAEAFGAHGRYLVHGLAHCDPDALVTAVGL